jgi:hypothetical protein
MIPAASAAWRKHMCSDRASEIDTSKALTKLNTGISGMFDRYDGKYLALHAVFDALFRTLPDGLRQSIAWELEPVQEAFGKQVSAHPGLVNAQEAYQELFSLTGEFRRAEHSVPPKANAPSGRYRD